MDDKSPDRSRTGVRPETLKIDLPWEEAVARALRKPIPPEGVPGRAKKLRAPHAPKK